MKEKWRDVVGYERIYQVSDYGLVRRIGKGSGTWVGRILKANLDINGRSRTDLWKNGKRKTSKIHRLVLEAFVGPCPSGMVTRHLDGNPKNNKLNNLKWGTHSENTQDSIKHGTFFGSKSYGVNNGNSKLTENDVKRILTLLKAGKLQKEIMNMFGISSSRISEIKSNKTWRHVKR